MKKLWLCLLVCASAFADKSLEQRLLNTAKQKFPPSIHLEIHQIRTSREIPEEAKISFRGDGLPLGLVSFVAHWEADRGRPIEARGTAKVKAMGDIAVVSRYTRDNEVLGPSNVVFERRSLNQLGLSGYFLSWQELKGLRAKGSLRPGSPILHLHTQLPFLVERSQMVDLVHRKGALKVTVRVKALQSGRKGDWISVQNLSSRRMLQARVIGPSLTSIR